MNQCLDFKKKILDHFNIPFKKVSHFKYYVIC